MKESEYYTPQDIKNILNCSTSTAYKWITKINEQLKKDYPNIIIFKTRIPIWYWNLITKGEIKNEI